MSDPELSVELFPYRLRFRTPLRTAVGTFTHREGLVVRLSDGELQGCGEAAPLPGFSVEGLEEVKAALLAWHPRDPGEGLRGDAFEGLPGPAAARHGAEQALLSLIAARRGVRVAEVLAEGREVRERVEVNGLAEDPQRAREVVARGIRCVKVKVGFRPLDEDLARVKAIRQAIGPSIALRLDANQGWDLQTARRAIDALASLDLALIEEPVAGLREMALLRGPIPLGADESIRDAQDLERVIALRAADVVVVKPMRVGGLREATRMLWRAEAAGLGAIVTTSLEGAIGRWGALHVAAAGEVLASGLDTGHLLVDEPWRGFQVHEGEAVLAAGHPTCP